MYGMLQNDLARTFTADREREISRLAIERAAERAAGDSPTTRLHSRLIAAARGLRTWKWVGPVRPASPSVAH
jgi:hypothetical protein